MIDVAVDANALAWGWGGIPRYIARLAEALAARDDMRITLLTNARRCPDRPGGNDRGGVPAPERRALAQRLRERLAGPAAARRLLRAETLSPLRVPVPVRGDGPRPRSTAGAGSKPRREQLAYRASIPRAVRRAAVVLTPSRATADDVHEMWRVPRERLRTVPLGVDEIFAPGDRAAALATARDLGSRGRSCSRWGRWSRARGWMC